MIFRNKTFFILVKSILIIALLQSCDRISDNNIRRITVPNECVVGLSFIGGSNSSDEYSRGNFIKIPINHNDVWQNVLLNKADTNLYAKDFIIVDSFTPEYSLLFDSLSYGNYKLNYISVLEDTIVNSIDFKYNIEIHTPKSIKNYYKTKNASDMTELLNISKNDTLQIYNSDIGCFGGTLILYEFYKDKNDKILFRKKVKAGGYYNEPNDEWIYYNADVSIKLLEFLKYLKEKNLVEQKLCSSGNLEYIARLKSSNEVFYLKDHQCGEKLYLSDIVK